MRQNEIRMLRGRQLRDTAQAYVCETLDRLLGMELGAQYAYKLRRCVGRESPALPHMQLLKRQVLAGAMVCEVHAEQMWHGGWARFGTEDLTLAKKVPTTTYAMRRLTWLEVDKDEEPLSSAMEYLQAVYDGQMTPPEGGEVNERWPEVLRLRCAALMVLADPYAVCLDELLHRWRLIASAAFHDGLFDQDACREMQSELLGIRAQRLIPIPLQLLVCRPGFLPEAFQANLLRHCWQLHLEGTLLWPDGKLNDLPVSFRDGRTGRCMNTMESMACFRGCGAVLEPAIAWLLDSRGEDGLWDYGPQKKDPAGYPRRLAAMDWRKLLNRRLDCTMEVLMLLQTYLRNN